jgi:hypothetical protein
VRKYIISSLRVIFSHHSHLSIRIEIEIILLPQSYIFSLIPESFHISVLDPISFMKGDFTFKENAHVFCCGTKNQASSVYIR